MLLFLDNDIILKLSSAGLLKEIEKIYSCTADNIFVLPTAKYYISNSSSVKKKYAPEVVNSALESIKDYSDIPDQFINDDNFLELANIEGIDSGEQILFSISVPDHEVFYYDRGQKSSY